MPLSPSPFKCLFLFSLSLPLSLSAYLSLYLSLHPPLSFSFAFSLYRFLLLYSTANIFVREHDINFDSILFICSIQCVLIVNLFCVWKEIGNFAKLNNFLCVNVVIIVQREHNFLLECCLGYYRTIAAQTHGHSYNMDFRLQKVLFCTDICF